jgi:hypothetical protein
MKASDIGIVNTDKDSGSPLDSIQWDTQTQKKSSTTGLEDIKPPRDEADHDPYGIYLANWLLIQ